VGTWNGGFAVDFNVPFNTNVDSWRFAVLFSSSFTCLRTKSGIETDDAYSYFAVNNASAQTAGSVVTISANIGHNLGTVLTITDLLLNGQKVCGNSSARMENHRVHFSRQTSIRPIEGFNLVKKSFCLGGCCCAFDNDCICKDLQAQSMTCNKLIGFSVVNGGTVNFELAVPFSQTVTSLTVTVTFSTPITSLSSSNSSHVITQGPTDFQISNISVDPVQCPNSPAILYLTADGITPETAITAVTVNGQTVCTGGTRMFQQVIKRA